eukprot:TRINITY_DN2317_c1_g1_i1.p1 TRINITY_DN2317_c1_g1~~TRINITY_DN2317_c1_g1_i1.p1  ORF type:complete len:573 (-),score=105.30 TRINITY_DN2317_c1_g1_i1:4-1689(-)
MGMAIFTYVLLCRPCTRQIVRAGPLDAEQVQFWSTMIQGTLVESWMEQGYDIAHVINLEVDVGTTSSSSSSDSSSSSVVVADEQCYIALLSGYAQLGRWSDVDAVIARMRSRGILVTAATYQAMIRGYGQAKAVERAAAVVTLMKQAGTAVDGPTYGQLLAVLVRAGRVEDIDALLQEMWSRGLSPQVEVYTAILHTYGQLGEMEKVDRIFHHMQQQQQQQHHEESAISLEEGVEGLSFLAVQLASYRVLADVYSRGSTPEAVEKVLQQIQQAGLAPDSQTYNNLIRAYGRAKRVAEAAAVLRRMQEQGVHADTACYNSVIKAYCQARQPQQAAALLDDMSAAGCHPDRESLEVIVSSYAQIGEPEMARTLIAQLPFPQTQSLPQPFPSTQVWNDIITAYCRTGQAEGALRCLSDMDRRGCSPNSDSYRLVVTVQAQAGSVEQAVATLQRCQAAGFDPDHQALDAVFVACVRHATLDLLEVLIPLCPPWYTQRVQYAHWVLAMCAKQVQVPGQRQRAITMANNTLASMRSVNQHSHQYLRRFPPGVLEVPSPLKTKLAQIK